MAQILYITANPNSFEYSVGHRIGQGFLKSYRETHKDDEIIEIDLYKEDFQTVDEDVLNAWRKMRKHNMNFAELNLIEQEKINALNKFADRVVRADKYVFVSPMWNWGVPPRLKAFIDSFVVVGKTFYYTEKGPVGYLNNKKAIHIQISGGIYSHGPAAIMDHSHPYLKMVLSIVGISDLEALYVEGHEINPEKAEEIISEAMTKAVNLAIGW
ncbi:FMN-dependent NADH-azoreductase [Paenibacillus sp. WQ 127069]|uniref:FMN dependent NADH:quinone oxidoreductase n=1 Tax=Paenibacillus baimaensis TaxID=2982185 RepID=A0ABT2UCC5_9BACL|nr:FMN-dependent NADH-azoreductase [Paenibacillus sp. WQ 127069]MCU6792285.1 FMN-dependent NADH-azoreductase [Paenibacillus sp. WQ 127069]